MTLHVNRCPGLQRLCSLSMSATCNVARRDPSTCLSCRRKFDDEKRPRESDLHAAEKAQDDGTRNGSSSILTLCPFIYVKISRCSALPRTLSAEGKISPLRLPLSRCSRQHVLVLVTGRPIFCWIEISLLPCLLIRLGRRSWVPRTSIRRPARCVA